MLYVSPGGHNWGPINWDDLSKIYMTVISVWSTILALGFGGIIYFRQLPFVRIRKVAFLGAGLGIIHVYMVMVFLVYPLNGTFSCKAEYWIMGVYLPFGVALFQLQNIGLFSQDRIQEALLEAERQRTATGAPAPAPAPAPVSKIYPAYYVERFNRMNAYQRLATLIVLGLVVQVKTRRGDAATFSGEVLEANTYSGNVVHRNDRYLFPLSKV